MQKQDASEETKRRQAKHSTVHSRAKHKAEATDGAESGSEPAGDFKGSRGELRARAKAKALIGKSVERGFLKLYDLDVFDTFLVNGLNFNYKLHVESQAVSLNEKISEMVSARNRNLRASLEQSERIEKFATESLEKMSRTKQIEIADICKLTDTESSLNEPFVGLFEVPVLKSNESSGGNFNRKSEGDSDKSSGENWIRVNGKS